MALGTDGLITVVGDFDTLDGSPVSGKVTVTPSVEIRRGAITYPQLPTVVSLDADGKFSLKLPASDDPAVTPNGFTYRFDVAVSASVAGRSVTDTSSTNFALPMASADTQGIAQLSTLAPAPEVGTPSVFLTRTVADLRYALKGEGGGNGGGAGLDAETVRDLVGGVLVAGANVSISVDDAANTVTISSTGSGDVGGGSTTVASITDATAVGKAVLLAASSAAARTSLDAAQTTHAHTSSQVTDFVEASQDATAAMIRAGSNVTIAYDDTANTFTINSTAGGGGGTTDAEVVRDTIAAALVGGANLQITVDDAADTITLAVTGIATVGKTGAYADLTGKPTIPAVSTAGVSGSYTDLTNKPTIPAAPTTATIVALLPNLLKNWARIPIDMAVGTITYNSSGAPTGHNVEWPDGATGVYAGTANGTFPGSIDSYTVTHVLSGTTTTTYTQPTVTRDATTGVLTSRPTITVA